MRIRRKEILARGGGTTNSTVNSLDLASMQKPSRGGGADNKYRKLRGLGEYTRQSKDSFRSNDDGEYP